MAYFLDNNYMDVSKQIKINLSSTTNDNKEYEISLFPLQLMPNTFVPLQGFFDAIGFE